MNIFTEVSLIIVVATVMAGIMRAFKQPIIMGHILTGLLVGPRAFNLVHSTETIEAFSKVGISILLFIVGIGLSPKEIKETGVISIITGLGQVIFTTLFGFLFATMFGYTTVQALYIAIALTFSSTIIILKLLSDKKDTQKLYGRISIGFLLVQDIVATIIMIFAGSFTGEGSFVDALTNTLFKGTMIAAVLILVTYLVLPRLSHFFAKSQEFLFLFSIGWGLGLAALFSEAGFSVEIGALIAGIALAVSPYSEEISSKLKPLRDFFIISFFVLLGTEVNVIGLGPQLYQALFLSVFVLVGNPIIVMIIMGLMKYTKRTSFMAGLTVAQISEFSLILILLGVNMGHVDKDILSLVTIVGLITIAISSYMILNAEKLYTLLAPYLGIFERKVAKTPVQQLTNYEVVLFGANRVGYDFIKLFKKLGQSFLTIDFDPDVITNLNNQGINCKYGDAEDAEFLDEIGAENAKLIISTIPDYEANYFLTKHMKKINKDVLIIVISYNVNDALDLYAAGAAYVILPHFIGGHFAAMLAAEHWLDINRFKKEREKHIEYLHERINQGVHYHPGLN